MTIWASPRRTRFHSSMRSPKERPLWNRATLSPNRCWKGRMVWAVREISGTMTMTPFPSFTTAWMSWKNTRVFPLPVTP